MKQEILEMLYNAMDNGYEEEITNSTPEEIADDILAYTDIDMHKRDEMIAILTELREKEEI